MRSQRRKNAPASRESLLRALAHHKLSGIVRSVHEPTESQRRWQIEIIDVGLVEFTDPQVYALCVGLAAGSKGVHRVTQSLESVSEAMCEAATSFSCREAEWIAEAYRAGGHAGIAVEFLAHHAAGDVEGDEHFAGRVLPSECCHSRDFRTFNEDGTQSCRCGVVIGTDGRTIFYPKTLGRMVDEATELHERVLPSTRDVSEYASSAPGWAGEIVGS